MPHLFVDISAHGFGHLSQTAPVLDELARRLPDLRFTIRSGLPANRLHQRIRVPFDHLPHASDFGFVMIDALRIDLPATASAYRAAHAGFLRRVAEEAKLLSGLKVDAVLSNVAYLPLAGAAQAGLPAVALCSLNWADLFWHYFSGKPWALPIHAEMLSAYRSATFLRLVPGMAMTSLNRVCSLEPIAAPGINRRVELRERLGIRPEAPIVAIALGGIPIQLPIEDWPSSADLQWLVPAAWLAERRPTSTGFFAFEPLGWPFADILRSVDALVAKPGYGTFTEAARNGTAVIYQRREDWPEQDCLIDWLHLHARCAEVSEEQLLSGDLADAIETTMQTAIPPSPAFRGAEQAAGHIAALLA